MYEKEASKSSRCGLPEVMEMTTVNGKTSTWMSFGKRFVPLCVMEKGKMVEDLAATEEMNLKVAWETVQGKEEGVLELQTKKDKRDHFFWFKEFAVHVAGTITIEFSMKKAKVKKLVRRYEVLPTDDDAMDTSGAGTSSMGHLSRTAALHRPMGGQTKISGDGLALAFDDVLNKVFFDNYVDVVGLGKKIQDLPWEIPQPNAATILQMTETYLKENKSTATGADVAKVEAAFELVFHSKLLFEEERLAYGKAFERAEIESRPYTECAGPAHLLRLLVLISLRGSTEEFDELGAPLKRQKMGSSSSSSVSSSSSTKTTSKERMQEVANAIIAVIRKVTNEN